MMSEMLATDSSSIIDDYLTGNGIGLSSLNENRSVLPTQHPRPHGRNVIAVSGQRAARQRKRYHAAS